ncbi:MAG: ferrous iron transport protein A [Flavobacteriales bacterium]
MSEPKNLAAISAGKSVRIHAVKQEFVGSKLVQLGFLPGREIAILFKAPFNGPLAVEVNGTLLSLRPNEASLILIEEAGVSK